MARDVAEAIDHAAGRGELFAARDRLGGVCALLDALDRASRKDAAGLEVELGQHGETLAAVLDVMCSVLGTAVGELAGDDLARCEREIEYGMMRDLQVSVGVWLGRACVLVVPGDVVMRLREGLFSELAHFVGDLEQVVTRPADKRSREWVEPVARFDRVRAVLDLIGWEDRDPESDVEVEMRWYGRGVRDALAMELDSMWHLAQEEERQQSEWARESVAVIERFLAGLEE